MRSRAISLVEPLRPSPRRIPRVRTALRKTCRRRLGLRTPTERVAAGGRSRFQNRTLGDDRLNAPGCRRALPLGVAVTTAGSSSTTHPGPFPRKSFQARTLRRKRTVVWRDRLARSRDAALTANVCRQTPREPIRPEIIGYRAFLGGTISPMFRALFDKKTRREWSVFGARTVRRVDDQQAREARARSRSTRHGKKASSSAEREARRQPRSKRLRAISPPLERRPDPSKLPPDARIQFVASSFWHLQEPEALPPYSIRRQVLASDGLYEARGSTGSSTCLSEAFPIAELWRYRRGSRVAAACSARWNTAGKSGRRGFGRASTRRMVLASAEMRALGISIRRIITIAERSRRSPPVSIARCDTHEMRSTGTTFLSG